MGTSTEIPQGSARASPHERRAGREFALEWIFRPLAGALVPALLRLRIPPPGVVVSNATAGLAAAVAVARGELLVAAVLLQVKTILDNADGQLARASSRVTLAGRYLDSEADLVVNAALFAALGHETGRPWLGLAAFLGLTVVLSVDYNLSELYREVRGLTEPLPEPSGSRLERLLSAIYRGVFAPLDRLVRRHSAKRLELTEAGGHHSRAVALAYYDRGTATALANLGLSTQLAALGLCLVLDVPALYLWATLVQLVLLPMLQLRRERLARSCSRRLRGA